MRERPPPTSKQRGIALITALVIMAIAATIAAAMHWQGSLDTRRTATLIQGNQAVEYALGAEAWAEQILRRDLNDPKNNPQTVNLGQDWAAQLPPLPVEGGQIIGHIEDMQGRFNLDLLQGQGGQSTQGYFGQFQRLLTALNLDPNIAYAVSDWVNAGTVPGNPFGAKDDFYTRLQPPYLTADAPMTSVSELQLVKGVTPEVYTALAPYVCAIPMTTQPGLPNAVTGWLNVNTAPALLIATLAPNLTADQAEQIVGARGSQALTPGNFSQTTQVHIPNGGVQPGFTSSYFLLTVTAEIGSTHVTMYSLLKSSGNNVIAIRRTFGTL
ncbi:MAG TPA: type II secretion system minor pseudopilin GspK [Gammaproteobacteria bacterium]|nr:type II secretion system minor pseudopilin GspK [Gammaproteobacteria bacterium]